MELLEALSMRKVTRAFSDKPVPDDLLRAVLKAAVNSPSGSNMQPWEVYVVNGSRTIELRRLIDQAVKDGKRTFAASYSGRVPEKYTKRTHELFSQLGPYLAEMGEKGQHASLLDLKPASVLPASLQADVEEVSIWDAQYTLMREEVEMSDPKDKALYDLRIKRNTFAALAALEWMQKNKPDVVLIPNGLILEMGIVLRVARYLNIPAMTFEFNDQREQIWLAQNTSIMRQDTDYLVRERCSLPMTDEMYERLADLENARRGARVWGKSKRLWQYVSAQGADQTRKALGLDDRPVVLLAANVLADSLTLGRNIFAESMSERITKTFQYFAKRNDVQLVVRVHPGEKIVPQAKSMGTVVREALPEIPGPGT